MARISKTKKSGNESSHPVQLELIYSDSTQFKYWHSNLFNDVYLRKDLPQKYVEMWDSDDTDEFQLFMSQLRDLASEYGSQEKSLKKWSETETINNWIKHVLLGLGWNNKCSGVQNPYLEETSFNYDGRTYRTDILIVDLPKEKQYIRKAKAGEKLIEARESVLVPIEAKYWKRLEQYRQDQKEEKSRVDSNSDDISRTTSPNEQTLKYMEILKKPWGILTDGATWRLFHNEISSEDTERYYEFNLWALIESILTEETEQDRKEVIESAKYFYFFFSKAAHCPDKNGVEPFVDEVLRYSTRYVNKVEDDLKSRFVKAMNYACNGFYSAIGRDHRDPDLDTVRNIAESALFNILFTKSLESRNILPMNAVDYKKISLTSIIDKLERFDPGKDDEINDRNLNRSFSRGNGNSFEFDPNGTELHDRIVRLTKVVHDGKSTKEDFGFEIKGFRESVFSDSEWKLFCESSLSNKTWVEVLFELGYADSDIRSRKYQQIPYSYFTARQLGSIYESFLEFKLEIAGMNMVFEKKQWRKADLNSSKYRQTDLPTVKKNALFFTPDNKDRKVTGSYYTPDYIVQNILREVFSEAGNLSSNEILKLKVCDPAMGSGHFLVGALRHLTKLYLEVLAAEAPGDLKITLPEAKRKVLDACIFGVDINPRAVKLAKMSLWLESAHINYKLERLDDQLMLGDSLVDSLKDYDLSFKWRKAFPAVYEDGGFDALIGNPPYVYSRDKKLPEDYKDYLYSHFDANGSQLNTFGLFMEKSFELLKKGGFVSFIVPNNWLTISSFADLRKFVLTKSGEISVTNILDKVFDEANVDTSIFVAKEGTADRLILKEMKDKIVDFEIAVSKKEFSESGKVLNISAFKNPGYAKALESMKSSSTELGEVARVSTGLKAYQTGKGKPSQTEEIKKNRKFHSKSKTKSDHWKYLEGKDVCRYGLGWSGEYLRYGDFLAEPRKSVPFKGPRILVRQIPNKPPYMVHAVYLEGPYLNDINSMVVFEPQNGLSLKFLLGVLNSKIVSQWFEATFDKMQRNIFPQFKVGELKKFPVPEIDISDKSARKQHDRIVKLVEILLIKNEWKSSFDSAESKEIDEIVSAMFAAKSDEKSFNEVA